MIEREFEEKVFYDTIEEVKEDFIAHKIRAGTNNLSVVRTMTDRDKYCLIYTYGARGQEVRPGPKPLPADIIATYSLTLETENVGEISKVMNSLEEYFPGMKLYSYGVVQAAGEMATAMICLVNYEPEDAEIEGNENEEDGDVNLL